MPISAALADSRSNRHTSSPPAQVLIPKLLQLMVESSLLPARCSQRWAIEQLSLGQGLQRSPGQVGSSFASPGVVADYSGFGRQQQQQEFGHPTTTGADLQAFTTAAKVLCCLASGLADWLCERDLPGKPILGRNILELREARREPLDVPCPYDTNPSGNYR